MAENRYRAHVMLVDDDPLAVESLSQFLEGERYLVSSAYSAGEALELIDHRMPDILILDLCMPEIGGMELLAELRQEPIMQTLPVIVVSGLTDTDHIVNALRAGANDYVTKPVNLPVLLARIERHLELSRQMLQIERESQLNWQIGQADEVSGACNRQFLMQTLESEIYRSLRHNNPLSVILMNLDRFDELAASKGREEAAAVTNQVLQAVSGALRRNDKLCRFDQDVFCVIMTQTELTGAATAADNIRRWLEDTTFSAGATDVSVTASFGVTALANETANPSRVIDQAVAAIEMARKKGPSKICLFDGTNYQVMETAQQMA